MAKKYSSYDQINSDLEMLKLEKEEELTCQMLSHKASFDMIRRMENLDDQCN
jgi:hypothetical protein